ncbi:hypothetical protein AVMA1855_25885 [Acidovorax sp. SUPP1855]|uniref:hypothetical protein n=1 Tax=Acidovorax sp. SUPP1855 TaxID=431774 RepID=UPI0023DE1D5C|nr:hypothetical protein [Acidovorax sp. SUPP1855]GKS87651.1 hypothetical protein AVMA1855_25885 [Acidovorax sp. SUPP1855]
MTAHLEFFKFYNDPKLVNDTNISIGDYLIALVYPSIFIITPSREEKEVNVNKPGLTIKPDSYPIQAFFNENPEFCEAVIETDEGLSKFFEDWSASR